MDLGNPLETVMHYLLIRRITSLSHQDGFPLVSALVCMVTHWIRPTVNHDENLSLVIIHRATLLCGLSTLREY